MKRFGKRELIIWGAVLVLAWGIVAYLLIRAHGNLTVEEILSYHPNDPVASGAAFLGLCLLKSVDFIMHSAVLFTACGIMFNIPTAIMLNYIGAVIMITPFYFLGRHAGRPLLISLTEKHEKLKVLTESGVKSRLLLAALLRSTGLSMHLVSLYLGASDTRYGDYLCGSLLGLTPMIIVYTVLGQSASDVSSPAFIVSAVLGIVLPLASLVVYALIKRSQSKKNRSAISSKENDDYNNLQRDSDFSN